ncbi:MAG: DUF2851 family protein [Rubricoccaceae bacterium]|nr:DUF2851 family protein [Rubricoccaceae bacterium]
MLQAAQRERFYPPLTVLEPDARVQGIPEAVIQDIWANQQFDGTQLTTVAGDNLSIHNPGLLNTDSGPDFSEAHLQIETLYTASGLLDWIGDVEIHRTSGEWLLHRHHEDPRYNRVVLHVVLLEDRHTGSLRRADGTLLPELVLYPRLNSSLRSLLYRFYTQPRSDFYCQGQWKDVPLSVKSEWLTNLGRDRLRAKADALFLEDETVDDVIYNAVFRALGYSKNADAMSELARRVPLEALQKIDAQEDVEALLFGTAGLLPDLPEMMQTDRHSIDYVVDLQDRYSRLRERVQIQPMRSVHWQYFRLRPANFPTLRIAQAAALLSTGNHEQSRGFLSGDCLSVLHRCLSDKNPLRSLRALVRQAEPSSFWNDHLRFEKRSSFRTSGIGKRRADRIIVDALLPILLKVALDKKDERLISKIEAVLRTLPTQQDEITERFARYEPLESNVLISQGVHELYRNWCTAGRCLSCEIGKSIREGLDHRSNHD